MADTTARQRGIVTGAARGIGYAIAAALVARGDAVTLLDRDPDVLTAARTLGVGATVIDLTDADGTTRAICDAAEAMGGLELLVNNAGIFRSTPLLEIRPDEWDEMFAVNVRSMLTTMQAAAPLMSGGGAVVNLASMGGKEGEPGQAHYAASKAAVISLTRVAAQELGPANIRVNCLCPGYVLTEMGEATRSAEQVERWKARSPLGRLTAPEDIAAHVLFLSSPGGAAVTGQALNVTAGMIMH